VTTVSRPKALSDLVLAAGRTLEPTFADLVAHGVGEGFHWRRAGDRIAVEVEQRVQLVESETPVAAQQCEACGTQRSTHERVGLVVQRR
jgi:hypothetical protein